MHEFSLVARILERACAIARDHGGRPIERIVLEVGALQQVVPEALEFAFDASKQGTLAGDARLDWREIPARVRCSACGMAYEPEDLYWVCPECAAAGGEVLAGDDLILSSVVLQETETGRAD